VVQAGLGFVMAKSIFAGTVEKTGKTGKKWQYCRQKLFLPSRF